MLGECRQWSFSKDGAESAVRVSGPLRSNNGELLCRAAVEGLGLIRASELEVLCELRSGKLVQVLADFEVATNAALWALYPSAKHVLPRMRALLDFLADWFRDAGNGGADGGRRRRLPWWRTAAATAPPAPRCSCARAEPPAQFEPRGCASRSSMRLTAAICGPSRVR